MSFRIDQDFLLIGREPSGFSKTYFYEWDDGLGGGETQLLLNFSFRSNEASGEDLGDAIFEVMKNYFFHELDRDSGDRFEDMLKEVNHTVKQKEEEWGLALVPHMSVIPAVLSQNTLFLSQCGVAEAYLIRRRFVSTLTDGLSDPKTQQDLFVNIASGELAAGDAILLCSSRLVRYITKSDLGRLISEESDVGKSLESIADAVSIDLPESITLMGVYVGEEKISVIEGELTDVEPVRTSRFTGHLKRLTSSISGLKLHLGKLIPQRKPKAVEPSEEEVVVEEDRPEAMPSLEREESSSAESTPEKPSKGRLFLGDSENLSLLVKEWRDLKRDKILILLIVVVIVLLFGIYLVRHQGQKQQYLEDLEAKLVTVETNINTAQTAGSYDKEAAKELLDEAEALSLEVLNSGYLRGKANEYLAEIEAQRDQLDNVNRIEAPTVFVDFSVNNPSMNALGMVPFGDNLFVYEYNQLHEIILDEVQAPVMIDADEVVVDAEYHEEVESILFLTKSNRVIEYNDGQFSFVDTEDGSWHSAVDMELYNNRIYLLDPTQGQIWRYYSQRDGYGTAESYITDGTSMSDALSFSIDGALYVLNAGGEIVKLLSGEAEEFEVLKGPTTDLSGATKLYTEFEMFQVFLLDPSDSRILIYNKDAKSGNLVYSAQYVLENTEELRDIYVDKESSRVYVLGKTKIYEFSF